MNAPSISLRLAIPDDASTMALMSRDLVEAGLGWQYRSERIRKLIDDVNTVALVAADGKRVVGFAIMTFGDERAHLVLLAVRPGHQRRGIAQDLVEWLLESASVAGVATVQVELRADNAAAHALYRKLEFAQKLRAPNYYRGREAALVMVRTLREPGVAPVPPRMLDKY